MAGFDDFAGVVANGFPNAFGKILLLVATHWAVFYTADSGAGKQVE
jgi:hypothetical protein